MSIRSSLMRLESKSLRSVQLVLLLEEEEEEEGEEEEDGDNKMYLLYNMLGFRCTGILRKNHVHSLTSASMMRSLLFGTCCRNDT